MTELASAWKARMPETGLDLQAQRASNHCKADLSCSDRARPETPQALQLAQLPLATNALQVFFWWQTVAGFDNPMIDEASSILDFCCHEFARVIGVRSTHDVRCPDNHQPRGDARCDHFTQQRYRGD